MLWLPAVLFGGGAAIFVLHILFAARDGTPDKPLGREAKEWLIPGEGVENDNLNLTGKWSVENSL